MQGLEFPAWDPVLLDLPGPLDVRWYGLMYVVAFVVGNYVLNRLAKARLLPVPPEKTGDFIFYLVLGVILGGRLGYAIFYDLDLADPWKLIRIWEGGLSFHGGLLGVVVAAILFARKNKAPILRVFDACAIATPPGVLAVRCANFINGELYGRVTSADTWGAMRFPTEPMAINNLGLMGMSVRDRELGIQYAYRKVDWEDIQPELSTHYMDGRRIDWESIKEGLDWEKVAETIPYRHPSQLYEGLGEGLLLGIVLALTWFLTRRRPLGRGAYAGIFLLGYGVVRFCLEYLRQPDSQFKDNKDSLGVVFFDFTMGQVLCFVMILAGAMLLLRAPGQRRREEAAA